MITSTELFMTFLCRMYGAYVEWSCTGEWKWSGGKFNADKARLPHPRLMFSGRVSLATIPRFPD